MKNNITAAYFILTENCNLRCTYCFEKDTRAVSQYMNEETAFKTIDFLFENAKKCDERKVGITFFGGEPALCVDLMRSMLRYTNRKEREYEGIDANISIITNGTIYNDDYESFLEEWFESRGSVDIQLSVDGTPEIQNINRPCANSCLDSSKLVEECAEKYKEFFKRKGIKMNQLHIHACISKKSLPYLYEIHKYFTRVLRITYKFAWVIEDEWDDNDVAILDRELDLITNDLCNRTLNRNDFVFKHFDKCSGCSSGRRLICVDTKGDIYPCHRFFFYKPEKRDELIIGNIHNEVPINEEKREVYKNIDESKMCDLPCQVCVAVNYSFTGDLHKRPNEYDVKFMAIINRHYYRFCNIIERKQVTKTMEEMAKQLNKQQNMINMLSRRVMYLEELTGANKPSENTNQN